MGRGSSSDRVRTSIYCTDSGEARRYTTGELGSGSLGGGGRVVGKAGSGGSGGCEGRESG